MSSAQPIHIAIATILIALSAGGVGANNLTWLDDLEHAKQAAAREHKDLLINFTGTTWCQACMALECEVLSTEAFAPAADTFILVRLEYPGGVSRLPQEPAAPASTWVDQYGVVSYPTVFLADENGKPYATTGAIGLSPAEFLKHVLKLRGVHEQRDAAFAKAANAAGSDRAHALDAGLKSLEGGFDDTKDYSNANPLLKFYRSEIDEVVRLGAEHDKAIGEHWRQVVASEDEELDRKAFAKQLSDAYSRAGIKAVLPLIDEKTRSDVSDERKKELAWTRLTYLEWADHHSDAIAYANELIQDKRFTAQD